MLSWPDDFVFWVVKELAPVGQPSYASWNHEKHWEHVSREPHCFVNDSTVKVNIRIKFSLDEERIAQGNFFQLDCNFNKLLLSSNFKYFMCNLLNNFCSWIVRLVDSMSKAVQKFLSAFDVFNELWDVLFLADLFEHSQDSLIGTSMFRSVKSTRSTSNTGVYINA